MKYIFMSIVFLVVAQLVWTNTLVGSGRDVRAVDVKIAALRGENEMLVAQVASASSLLTMAERVTAMGFVAPSKSQYVMIQESVPVALAP